jgi:hypothetical protein
MSRAALLMAFFVMAVLVACGPGGEPTPTPGAATPTPPPGETPVITEQATVVEVVAIEYELQPREINIEKGKPYKIRLINKGNKPHNFTAHRWRIEIFAPAGESAESEVFLENTPGEYACWDRLYAARYEGMKCVIKVSE